MNPREGGQFFPERNHNPIPNIPLRHPVEKGGSKFLLNFLERGSPKSRNPKPPLSQPSILPPIDNIDNNKVRGPTQKEKDRAKRIKGELSKQEGKITTPVVFTLGGLGLLGTGFVGGWFLKDVFAAEPTPASRDIDSVPGGTSFTNDDGPQIVPSEQVKKPNKDDVFDNEATRGEITLRMIKIVPKEEIQKLDTFAKLRENGKNEMKSLFLQQIATTPGEKAELEHLLVEVREDKGTLRLLYPLDTSESTNPNAKINYEKVFWHHAQVIREAFLKEKYYNQIAFDNVPDGTRIISPVDGFLRIVEFDIPRTANVPADIEGVQIQFMDENGNQYNMSIGGGVRIGMDRYSTTFVLENLTGASITSLEKLKEYNSNPIGSYGIPIKKGEAIAKVIQPSKGNPITVGIQIRFAFKGTPEKKATRYDPFILTNIELITSEEGKLIAPQKQ